MIPRRSRLSRTSALRLSEVSGKKGTREKLVCLPSRPGDLLIRTNVSYLPNQPIGLPDKSTHTLLMCV